MKLHVIAARQRLPPSILRRRARYAMASSRSGRAPPAAIPQGRGASLLARFPSTSARQPAGRAAHPAPVLRLRPPPPRRGARGTPFTGFPPAPAAVPQGRGASLLARFPSTSARHPAGARAVRHSPDFHLCPPPSRRAHCAQSRGMDSGIPTGNNAADGMDRPRWNWRAAALHTSRYPRIRRNMPQRRSLPAHLPLGQPSAHPGSSSLPRASRSGGAAAVRCPCAFWLSGEVHTSRQRFAPCASSAQATKRASRQQFAPPRLPLGRRGGGSLSLRLLAQRRGTHIPTAVRSRTSAAAPDMVIMPVPST